MARPRAYHPDRPATSAERMAALRAREAKPDPKPTPARPKRAAPVERSSGCPAFAPSGTKCKFCGKTHS